MLNRQNLFGKRDERVDALSARTPAPDTKPAPTVTVRPAAVVNGAPVATPANTEAAKNDTSKVEMSGSRLIVGPDVKLKGAEILDCDTLVVEGRVEATMDSRVIHIAEHGAFSGKVSIDVAEIHGHFEGELTVRNQLLIRATGRVNGKIRYGKILIDEGGQLSGDVQSLSAPELRVPAIAA